LQDKEKTDIYLIQDAEDKKFVALITDGTAIDVINSYFSTTTESMNIDLDHNNTTRKSMRLDVREYESNRRTNIPINPFLTSAAEAAAVADDDDDDTELLIVTPPLSSRLLEPLSSPSDKHDDYTSTPTTPTPPPPLSTDEPPVMIATTPIPAVSVAVDNRSKSKEVKKAKKNEERVAEKTDVYQEIKSDYSDFEAHSNINSKSKSNRTTVYPQNMVSSFGKDPQPSTVDDTTCSGKYIFSTMIMKGEQGMGLDLGKTKLTWDQGRSLVLRFKDFPNGEVNPALRCNPAIHIGDVIIAVNDIPCETLSDAVKVIRGLSIGNVKLTLERTL
jgi:hypothetical protein